MKYLCWIGYRVSRRLREYTVREVVGVFKVMDNRWVKWGCGRKQFQKFEDLVGGEGFQRLFFRGFGDFLTFFKSICFGRGWVSVVSYYQFRWVKEVYYFRLFFWFCFLYVLGCNYLDILSRVGFMVMRFVYFYRNLGLERFYFQFNVLLL